MALQLTLSCDADKTDSGPTLIHSTGVENYKIPPDVFTKNITECYLFGSSTYRNEPLSSFNLTVELGHALGEISRENPICPFNAKLIRLQLVRNIPADEKRHQPPESPHQRCEKKIRILQGALTNDLLSDHADGVLCQGDPHRILDILRQNGFTVENENNDEQKATWTVVQGGHGDGGEQPVHPAAPHPTDENEPDTDGGAADAGEEQERAGSGEEAENKTEEEKEAEEEEE